MAGFCVCGNEPPGVIKWEEFFHQLEELLASQEGLSSLELVSNAFFAMSEGF